MAFRGNYEYQLDDRNRVTIPPRYRDDFAAGGILTPGVERCIQLYTQEGYEQEARTLQQVPGASQAGRMARRAFFGSAFDVQKDGQGRVLIPAKLMAYAGRATEVVGVGLESCLEIWDRQAWAAQEPELAATRLAVLNKLGEWGPAPGGGR